MVAKPLFTPDSLRELIALGEGQFLELKGTWSYAGGAPQALGKDAVRAMVAEYVAAFANADGGTLVIGVEDDGTATGHGRPADEIEHLISVPGRRLRSPLSCDHQILELDDEQVLVIEVGLAPQAVMVDGNGFPYRTGDQVIKESEERINALKQAYRDTGFEQRLANATPDDVDASLLPPAASNPVWMAQRGLVVPRHGTPAVSNAAVLLAGCPPIVRWHPSQSVRVFRVEGVEVQRGERRNVTQVERLELPIAELIPAAYEVLLGQIRRSERRRRPGASRGAASVALRSPSVDQRRMSRLMCVDMSASITPVLLARSAYERRCGHECAAGRSLPGLARTGRRPHVGCAAICGEEPLRDR